MKLSTIRLVTVPAVVAGVAILGLAGCSTTSTSTPAAAPSATVGPLGAPTTPPPASAITSSCVLGWFSSDSGGTFTPGPAHGTQLPGGFQATLTNGTSQPVAVSWVNVSVFFHGRKVGNQTIQNDTADTIAPHQADSSWSVMFVPNEGEAKVPLSILNATNGNIENHPGFTCKVSQWGDATGN